jgi:hypothetical protein
MRSFRDLEAHNLVMDTVSNAKTHGRWDYTPWARKHSLISSCSKIKTYWNMCINVVTADTLTQKVSFLSRTISVYSSHRQRTVKSKMALTPEQRSWCVLEFAKTNSVVTVQRAFKRRFNVDPPTNKCILKWYGNFIEKGCICDQRKGHSGRPSVSEQVVDRVREAFLRSPKKSTHRASRELRVPQSTVSKILRRRLR